MFMSGGRGLSSTTLTTASSTIPREGRPSSPLTTPLPPPHLCPLHPPIAAAPPPPAAAAALPTTSTSAHPTRCRECAARAHGTDAHRRLPSPLLLLSIFARSTPLHCRRPVSFASAATHPPAPRLTLPSPVVAADCRFGILRSNVSLHLSLAMQPTPSPPPAAAYCPFGSSSSGTGCPIPLPLVARPPRPTRRPWGMPDIPRPITARPPSCVRVS
jgi:hypothetical protein